MPSTAPLPVALVEGAAPAAQHPGLAPVAGAMLAACGVPTIVPLSQDAATVWEALEVATSFAAAPGHATADRALATIGAGGLALVSRCRETPWPASSLEEGLRQRAGTGQREPTPLHIVAGASAGDLAETVALAEALRPISVLVLAGQDGSLAPWCDRPTPTDGRRPGGAPGDVADPAIEPKCYGVMLQSAPDWRVGGPSELAARWEEALRTRHRRVTALVVRILVGAVLAHIGKTSTIMRGLGLAHRVIADGSARAQLLAAAKAASAD